MTMADNPLVTVDIYDVVGCQFLHVNEREGSEADKDEDVANKGQIVIFELMSNNSFQFVFGQKLPFLAVRTDMELRKWVTGNLAVIVCSQYNTLQPHAALPDSGIGQSPVCTEVGRKVLDELWGQLQHRHIRATIMRLDKLGHILS